MNIFQVYETYVADRTAEEQLQLATLILRQNAPLPTVDESDEWTDQDMRDWSNHSLARFEAMEAEEQGATG